MLKLFHCPAGSNAPSRSSFWLQLATCLGNEFTALLAYCERVGEQCWA